MTSIGSAMGFFSRMRLSTASILGALVMAVMALHPNTASASCASPGNAIEAENCLPGSDPSLWSIDGSGDPTIQGFATDISVNVGGTINFKVNTTATAYTIGIFRLGYYGGLGARQVATVTPSVRLPQSQPACITDATTQLYDCGNWAVSASWTVPSTAVSGVYIAHVMRTDTGGDSQIVFVVRNDSSHSDIVFQTADESWQAYNPYGGHSFYGPGGFDLTNRAYKVSYNRPFTTLDLEIETWILYAEWPMIQWLEANGYDVSYISSIDTVRSGSLITNHKAFFSVGHDEYVSAQKRASIEAARAAGTHLAFFTGNEFFWKTRWENSIDGTNTPYRTLVCYKETLGPSSNPVAVAAVDPDDPPTWTGTWRDPAKSPPADGGRPENALTGQLFKVNGPGTDNTNLSIQVPAAEGKLRFWRNTQVAAQAAGATWTLPAGTLGYEWDAEVDNGFRPPGLFDLSTATYTLTTDYLQDAGGLYGGGIATHHMSLYRASSGALVFGAGTVQWSWGLNTNHTGTGPTSADVNMQQATVNLLADMGVQPVTLQSGLAAATASTDKTPPTSTITGPSPGATVQVGRAVTISGTALDAGGGVVAGVEVSTDGGTTWHPATGTTSWSYIWYPGTPGATTIESRSVDDSGNLETPTSTVTVSGQCPCDLFSTQTPANPNATDGTSYELGMKFQVATTGQITGIRYWKAPSETGSHTGNIWSSTGTLLASVGFSGETASGWQVQSLATALTLQANTTYVVSVNANSYYVATDNGLASSLVNGDVSSVADGGNGVYGTSGTFPTKSFDNTNYFRDVLFAGTATLLKESGDGQTAAPGAALAAPLVVEVINASGLPVSGATVSFSVTSGGGSLSTGSVTTGSNGQASVTLTLGSTVGTNTVQATASGYGSVSFSADGLQNTVFSSQTPASPSVSTSTPYELGMAFQSVKNGQITGLLFWKAPGETGTHTGNLWSSSGTLLGSVTFSGETASGWQTQALTTPVTILANTTYVVSVNANAAYAATNNGLANSVVNGSVSSVANGANGVYGNAGQFPTSSYQNTNYFRDVSFTSVSTISKASGDGQTNAPGTALAGPLVVKALDSNGNPLSGVTVNFTVTSGGGSLSPASAVTGSNGQASTTLTLGPNLGTNTVQAVASGIGGSVSFTENALQSTVFGTQTPSSPNVSGAGTAYELGMKFQAKGPGQITGIRYWKASNETGSHTGNIWSASGTLLASVAFTGETASGWQIQSLQAPLTIQPNTTYMVSVNANSYYVGSNSGLASSIVNGVLASVADGADGTYGLAGTFPTSSYQNTNYFRDVSFAATASLVKVSGDGQTATAGTQLSTPLVVTVYNATGSPISGVTVNFSVTAGGGTLSSASVVSNSSGQASTTLTLGAAGGTNTVQAAATGYSSASFNETALQGSVLTTQTPATLNASDNTSYELGMKFQSSTAGHITAVRYWKASSETGTHTGNIWSASGTLLASVTFSGETASGWQVQQLSTPLAIQANTTYVVSVNVNSYYVATNSGLATSVVNGSLSSVAGSNGVFASPATSNPATFPMSSYQNTNYFRDVLFTAH